jgi:hypothetical protein
MLNFLHEFFPGSPSPREYTLWTTSGMTVRFTRFSCNDYTEPLTNWLLDVSDMNITFHIKHSNSYETIYHL